MGVKKLVFSMLIAGVILMSLITPFATMLSSVGIDNSTVEGMDRMNRISDFGETVEGMEAQIESAETEEIGLLDQIALVTKGAYAVVRSFILAVPSFIGFLMDVDYYLGLPDYLIEAVTSMIIISIVIMIIAYLTGRTQKDDN